MATEKLHGRKFRVLPPIQGGAEGSPVPPEFMKHKTKRRAGNSSSSQVTEDFRILAIGSPVPCGSTQDDFDLHQGGGTSFPAITVDKCDEEISNITQNADEDDNDEEDIPVWTPRQSPALLPRRSASIQDSLHRGRSSMSPCSSGFLSPTPTQELASSRSDGDLTTKFRNKCHCRPKLTIDVDRPPTPWGSHPGTPVSPASLSPFRHAPKSPSSGSPLSPRRPVRLLPLQCSAEEHNN
jgi:hypothetical protein